MESTEIRPIARFSCDLKEKFGAPRQAGIVPELEGRVIFEPEYRDPEALRGIEGFSHLWLIWQFSENLRQDWSPTVRPPRLGGNRRLGVFATRSPFRPNALGLSCVRLLGIEQDGELGAVLRIGGADLMDGTPIFDVKPYVPYADAHPEALSGFAPDPGATLDLGVLANDPRPRYHSDPERIYGLRFGEQNVKFTVSGQRLTVVDVET